MTEVGMWIVCTVIFAVAAAPFVYSYAVGPTYSPVDEAKKSPDYRVYARYKGAKKYKLHAHRIFSASYTYGYTATLELFVLKDSGKYVVYWDYMSQHCVYVYDNLADAKHRMRLCIDETMPSVTLQFRDALISCGLYADDTVELS